MKNKSVSVRSPFVAVLFLTLLGVDAGAGGCGGKSDTPQLGVTHAAVTAEGIGPELTQQGDIIAKVTHPLGGVGSKNLEVIRDGQKPSATDPAYSLNQYDTFDNTTPNEAKTDDWIGYQYTGEVTFARVWFLEGLNFDNGGWFTTLNVQVRHNGTWTGVTSLAVTPPYQPNNGQSYDSYQLDFAPIKGDAIRIEGPPGGTARFISVAELQVWAAPGTSAAPAARPLGPDITGPGTPIAKITAPLGGGSKDLSIIKNTNTPVIGTGDSNSAALQYDTYTGDVARTEDWIGYSYDGTQFFGQLVLQVGMRFPDGGWFESLDVQVRQNGTWVSVADQNFTPKYPTDGSSPDFKAYQIDFSPIGGDGIRVFGQPGGASRFISVASLRVLAGNPCQGRTDGTDCSDGDLCTVGDRCVAGVCQPVAPYDCGAPDDACRGRGICQRATGTCTMPIAADPPPLGPNDPPDPDHLRNNPCDDGNKCTVHDYCSHGTCIPGSVAPACTGPNATFYAPVTNLGSFQGQSVARDINEQGMVVGNDTPGHDNSTVEFNGGQGVSQAFRWTEAEGMTYAPSVGAVNIALGVNASGDIAGVGGSFRDWQNVLRSRMASGTSEIALTQAGGAAINDAGEIAGWGYFPGQPNVRMFRMSDGQPEVISPPQGSLETGVSAPKAIDSQGNMVGYVTDADSRNGLAVLVRQGTVFVLNDLLFDSPADPDHLWSLTEADAIHFDEVTGTDTIVGWGINAGVPHAFELILQGGAVPQLVDLKTLSPYDELTSYIHIPIPRDINAHGEVVGSFHDVHALWPTVPFVYVPYAPYPRMIKLNDLIDPASGWTLSAAFGINDNREVVGFGYLNGEARAYRMKLPDMTPCPQTDVCHGVAVRDPASGQCGVGLALPNGTACPSTDQCIVQTTCQEGLCSGKVAPVCAVQPQAEGVAHIGGRSYAIFSYDNLLRENVHIPYGAQNYLSIGPRQVAVPSNPPPTWFLPDKHAGAYFAPILGDNLSWTIGNVTATVLLPTAKDLTFVTDAGQGAMVGDHFVLVTPDPNFQFKDSILLTESDGGITAGQFAGTFNVTDDGNAAYNVPLWVPPGRAGMQPNLSINYNSGSGSGLLGVGFSISGLSRISLCNRTLARDEQNAAPQVQGRRDSDALCLDGEKLVPLPGNGKHTGVYRTEHDSLAKITLFQAGINTGPDSFEVRTKDGRIMHYGGPGATVEGEQAYQDASNQDTNPPVRHPLGNGRLAWLLQDVQDRSGNKMTFEYKPRGGSAELVIDAIRYTGFGSDPGHRYVKFIPSDKADGRVSFVGGVELSESTRIDQIQMFAPAPGGSTALGDDGTSRLLRSYKMTYELAPINGRTRLTSISDCDGAGTCKNPITFQWTDNNPAFSALPTFQTPISPGQNGNPQLVYAPQLADINGDGRDDLVYLVKLLRPPLSWVIKYRLAGSGGTFGEEKDLNGPGGKFLEPVSSALDAPAIIPIDVNMDGRVDLAMTRSKTTNGRTTVQWVINTIVLDNDGTPRFVQSFDDPFTDAKASNAPAFADLNGDGLPDMVRRIIKDDNSSNWFVAFNSINGFASPVIISPGSDTGAEMTAPIRNDGTMSLLNPDFLQNANPQLAGSRLAALSATGTTVTADLTTLSAHFPGTKTPIFYSFSDFNGDGLADASAIVDAGPIRIFMNTGFGYRASQLPNVVGTPHSIQSVGRFALQSQIGDYDQDGVEDHFTFFDDTVAVLSPHSSGDIFRASDLITTDGKPIPGRPAGTSSSFFFASTGDFNGDGLTDFIVVDPPRDPSALPVGNPDSLITFRPYVRVGPKADQVKLITTALGAKISISYAPSNVKGGKSDGCSYPTACFKVGPWVVQDVFSDAGAIQMHDSYTFSGARSDLTGRGWLGFSSRTVEHKAVTVPNETTLSQTVTTFDNQTMVGVATGYHEFQFAGIPATETTTVEDAGITTVHSRTTTYDIVLGSSAKDHTFVVAPTYEIVDAQEYPTGNPSAKTTLSHHETSFGYDSHANKNFEQTTFSNPPEVLTTSGTYEANELDWLVGQPTSTTSTSSANDLTATRSTSTINDPVTGLPRHTTIQGGGGVDQQLDITYVRNTYGLLLSTTSAALNGETRTVGYGYDSDNMFVTSTTNALGQTSQQVVHPGLGIVTAKLDANGFQTTAAVDGFGRPRSESSPSGASVTHSYQSLTSGDIRYQVQTSSNSGAVSIIRHDFLDRQRLSASLNFTGDAFNLIETRYDDLHPGLVSGVTVPQKIVAVNTPSTHLAYDKLGRIKTSTALDGAVTTYQYDGPTATMTDPRSHQTTKTVDQKGRTTLMDSVVPDDEPNPGHHISTITTYGPFDLVATVTDVNGNVVTKKYDALGRQTDLFDPDKGHEIYEYSAFGDLRGMTDGNSNVDTYIRDLLGRILFETTHDGITTFVWDLAPNGIGSAASNTGPDGTAERFTYFGVDNRGTGLRATETMTIPADHVGGKDYTVSTGYDDVGRVSTVRYPNIGSYPPVVVSREYGPNGNLQSLNRGDIELWRVIERDEADRVHQESAGNHVVSTTDYFPDSMRLKEISSVDVDGNPARALSYTYDPAGNVATRSVDGVLERFLYDHMERLTGWQQSVDSALDGDGIVFDYDDIDNMLSRSKKHFVAGLPVGAAQDVVSFTPGDGKTHGPHQMVASRFGSYEYDLKGDQRVAPDRRVTFTTFGLPHQVETANHATRFLYDAGHSRVWKDSASAVMVSVGALYEAEIRSGKTDHHLRVQGDNSVVSEITISEINNVVTSDSTMFLHQDHLGSPEAVSDDTGHIIQRVKYDVFGERLAGNNVTPTTDIGFTGQKVDADIELIDMKGRLYDHKSGRFISADPLVSAPFVGRSYNRYAYAFNNPMSVVDPSGFFARPSDVHWRKIGWGGSSNLPTCSSYSGHQCTYIGLPEDGASALAAFMADPLSSGQAIAAWEPGVSVAAAVGPSIEAGSSGDNGTTKSDQNAASQNGDSSRGGGGLIGLAPLLFSEAMAPGSGVGAPRQQTSVAAPFDPSAIAGQMAIGAGVGLLGVGALELSGWFLAHLWVAASAAGTGTLALPALERENGWAGPIEAGVTQTELTMYRVWGGVSGRVGEWLSPINPASSSEARAMLSLPAGNSASFVSQVTVPAGTAYQIGVAGPLWGQSGGWLQLQLLQRIPTSAFGPGIPLKP